MKALAFEALAVALLVAEAPAPVTPQPVAFSHRLHAGEAALACLHCHPGATEGDAATLPPPSLCMACHAAVRTDSPEVRKIAAAAESGKPLRWVRVYRVPDYVFFGHRRHLAAGATCTECHGPVETRDVLEKEVSTSMNACLECHRRRGAPTHCALCHLLGH